MKTGWNHPGDNSQSDSELIDEEGAELRLQRRRIRMLFHGFCIVYTYGLLIPSLRLKNGANSRLNLLTLHPRLRASLTSMSHSPSTRRGVHPSSFDSIVILVVGTMTLEEVGTGESFGADLDGVSEWPGKKVVTTNIHRK